MYRHLFKQLIDFLIAFILILVTIPFWLPVLILLSFANSGKPLFYQIRPGKNEMPFKIIKFKTMNDKTDSQGKLLPDEKRLTTVGKIVRKLSLDELPQLINVVKGELSLIGPRPLLMEYLPLYNEEQRKRHDVKPGISGWAQVNGRNTISWDQKFEYDVYYTQNMSFWLDLKILFLTIYKITRLEGISAEGQATMQKFEGTRSFSEKD